MADVISSRVRYARNYSDVDFGVRRDKDRGKLIAERISETFGSRFKPPEFLCDRSEKDNIRSLRWRITNANCSPVTAVTYSESEGTVILMNEEDDLRVFALCDGDAIDQAYIKAKAVIKEAERQYIQFLKHKKMGYLNSSFYNIGTGMRASVMVELPFVSVCGHSKALSAKLYELGLIVRGCDGEGSCFTRFCYQISNLSGYPLSEMEIINRVKAGVRIAFEVERKAKDRAKDNIDYFSHYVIKAVQNALISRDLTEKEMEKVICALNLGEELGLIKTQITSYEKSFASICERVDLEADEEKGKFRKMYIESILNKEIAFVI